MTVRKVAVTLPEELFDMIERARKIEHRSRSEMIQEAIRSHFGEARYEPTPEERRMVSAALEADLTHPEAARPWSEVRSNLWNDN